MSFCDLIAWLVGWLIDLNSDLFDLFIMIGWLIDVLVSSLILMLVDRLDVF